MRVDSIKNGIVIDHIIAGKAMQIYNMLELDKLSCSVALLMRVPSKRMGTKDIIKIDEDSISKLIDENNVNVENAMALVEFFS